MIKCCPKKTQSQCIWWEVAGISVLVFIIVYSILLHVPGYTFSKEILIATGVSISVLWCLWVVRVFRNIITWWTDLQLSIDNATRLLEETKADIKNIKSINQP